jgi:hypothetical protein
MIGRSVSAVTFATWNDGHAAIALDKGEDGAFFGGGPNALFFALPPTYVSSPSTTLFLPPKGRGFFAIGHSRKRWARNQAAS